MGSAKNSSDSETREQRIPEEAVKILKSLAQKWDDITDAYALQVVPLKGAMTNEVYQIKWPTNSDNESHHRSRKVVVRIYGKGVDVFFDRENEIRTFEFMSKQGQGPRLLGRFSSGRIEEFIRARVCIYMVLFMLYILQYLLVKIPRWSPISRFLKNEKGR